MTDQRRVLITGVSRGLGLAMTEEFARQGHVVFACARSKPAIERLGNQFPAPHHFAALDVSDDAQVAVWARHLLDTSGAPDLLINNAALINEKTDLWEVPPDVWPGRRGLSKP